MANHIRFIAITCDDVERARAFYEAVFGWTFEDWGPPDFYLIQGAGMQGALQKRHEPIVGTHPRSFEITVGVDDVDVIAAKVAAAGGTIVMQKTHLDGVGTLIHFTDTENNRVGAMKYEDGGNG
jgi:predicted enzyme related to lactoylglutathione lyase